jgi:hypothetical protein
MIYSSMTLSGDSPMQKENAPVILHPNEMLLIASKATLGHTVSPEEYQLVIDGYSRLMAESINNPRKKEALHFQYVRQQAFVKGVFKNA